MPPGFAHYNFFKSGYILEIPTASYIALQDPVAGLSHFIGYSMHRYVENDWDCVVMSASESRAVNELKLFGYPLFGISSIYGAIFRKHHRSFFTHFPLVSTLIRLLFVFGWWLIPLYWYGVISYETWHLKVFIYGLWGLSQADFIHWLADKLWDDDGKKFIEKNKKGLTNGRRTKRGRR